MAEKEGFVCIFCKAEADLVEIEGKFICKSCVEKIKTAE